jgi:hypothetical protein
MNDVWYLDRMFAGELHAESAHRLRPGADPRVYSFVGPLDQDRCEQPVLFCVGNHSKTTLSRRWSTITAIPSSELPTSETALDRHVSLGRAVIATGRSIH